MQWATSVQTAPAAAMARDARALGLNLAQCRACRGRGFAVLSASDAVSRFLAPRPITTAVLVAAVWAIARALA